MENNDKEKQSIETRIGNYVSSPKDKTGIGKRSIGNQWWKQTITPAGRKLLFKSPKHLWKCCCQYFDFQDAKKIIKLEVRGKDTVEVPVSPPYTMAGLCLYLGVNSQYIAELEERIGKKDADKITDIDKEFTEVCARVKQIIYIQKFEGATVNIFNASIIGQELGLANKMVLTGDKENPIQVHQITGMEIK